jgi:hypothetical protein
VKAKDIITQYMFGKTVFMNPEDVLVALKAAEVALKEDQK